MKIKAAQKKVIAEQVKSANGRARVRTIDIDDAIDLIKCAIKEGHDCTGSHGPFAGSYKGRPMATHMIAFRVDCVVKYDIWRDTATSARARSGCPITHKWWGRQQSAWTEEQHAAAIEWAKGLRFEIKIG